MKLNDRVACDHMIIQGPVQWVSVSFEAGSMEIQSKITHLKVVCGCHRNDSPGRLLDSPIRRPWQVICVPELDRVAGISSTGGPRVCRFAKWNVSTLTGLSTLDEMTRQQATAGQPWCTSFDLAWCREIILSRFK